MMPTLHQSSATGPRATGTRALLLLLLLAPACSDPLAPADVAGRYALERVGDDRLPVPWPGPADGPGMLLGAEIVLQADGSAEVVLRVEESQGTGPVIEVLHRSSWVFELDGSRLTLRPPPCDALDCVAVPGTMELRIFGDVIFADGGLLYRRADADGISTQLTGSGP